MFAADLRGDVAPVEATRVGQPVAHLLSLLREPAGGSDHQGVPARGTLHTQL